MGLITRRTTMHLAPWTAPRDLATVRQQEFRAGATRRRIWLELWTAQREARRLRRRRVRDARAN